MLEPQNGGLYALLTAEVASALGLPEGAFLSTGASPIETARAYPIAAAALGTDERRGAADGLGRAVRRQALDLLWGRLRPSGGARNAPCFRPSSLSAARRCRNDCRRGSEPRWSLRWSSRPTSTSTRCRYSAEPKTAP